LIVNAFDECSWEALWFEKLLKYIGSLHGSGARVF